MRRFVWFKTLMLSMLIAAGLGSPLVALADLNFQVSAAKAFNSDLRQIKPKPVWKAAEPIIPLQGGNRVKQPVAKTPRKRITPFDSLLLRQLTVASQNVRSASVEINVDGMGFSGVHPADPSGEVGKRYFIQAINGPNGGLFSIYNKTDGQAVVSDVLLSDLHHGDCANGFGKAIVLYDEQAERWLLSQLSVGFVNKLCVLVSQTDDPVSGGWYGYEFAATDFPDLPRYSQMGGVYYAATNESEPAIYAFERSKMLAGEPAAMVRQTVPSLAGFALNSLTPVDFDDQTDVADSVGWFIRHNDDEIHRPELNDVNRDWVELWSLEADFTTPENSLLTGPVNIAVSEFDSSFVCPGPGFGCLAQKDSTFSLDPMHQVVMYKPQYRRFSAHESIVGNFTVNGGNEVAAIRWFELRRIDAGEWSLYDEGTYAQADGNNRYMGSSALDDNGNLLLAYMVTGEDQYPSLAFSGKMAADPLGRLTFSEQYVVTGTGAIDSDRNGEYSQLSVDPVDACTFWLSSQYGSGNGQWGTRIASIKAPDCGQSTPGFTLNGLNLSQQVCGGENVAPITIGASGYQGFGGSIQLAAENLPNGFTLNFSPETIEPDQLSTASVTVADDVIAGSYALAITGSSEGVDSRVLNANIVVDNLIENLSLTSPVDGSVGVELTPLLSWSRDGKEHFRIEIALDSEFEQLLEVAEVRGNSFRPTIELNENSQYFWRVTATNSCGSARSGIFSFTTLDDRATATQLYKAVASDSFSALEDESFYFYVEVPEQASELSFSLRADNGDADLYISKGVQPGDGVERECTSEGTDSNEDCLIEGEHSGVYFAQVYAYEAFSDAVLTVTYQGGASLFIIGQQPLAVDEDMTLTIPLDSLSIVGGDSNGDYELQLLAGENYSFEGANLTPAADFFGELEVKLSISQGELISDTTAVVVNVAAVNDPPVIESTNQITILEDSSYSIGTNDINVVDVDNDYPQGFVLELGSGDFYHNTGLVITPELNYHGTLVVEVWVNDGQLDSQPEYIQVIVTPVNDAPVAMDDRVIIAQDTMSVTIEVLANDIEVDLGDTLSVHSVSDAANGQVSFSANEVSYRPDDGFTGLDSFEYTVIDSAGAQSTGLVRVNVSAKAIVNRTTSGGGSLGMLLLLLLALMAAHMSRTIKKSCYE